MEVSIAQIVVVLFWYCNFTVISENFIFANIHEFQRSQIQHSRKMFLNIQFKSENILQRS